MGTSPEPKVTKVGILTKVKYLVIQSYSKLLDTIQHGAVCASCLNVSQALKI